MLQLRFRAAWQQAAPALPWDAEAELGILLTSGNTESESFNGRVAGFYTIEQWKYSGDIEALTVATSDADVPGSDVITSTERYAANAQIDRLLEDAHSLFIRGNYDDDRFSGFEYETGLVVGYGRQLINTDTNQLRLEIGPGYRVSEPEVGPTEDEAILATKVLFKHQFNPLASFEQSLEANIGEERNISQSTTALRAQFIERLAMKFAYNVRYNSDPATSDLGFLRRGTDRETTVSLVYSF